MLNSVSLLGRLTADPELNSTPAGLKVCSFNLAVERAFKNKDGSRTTDFINIVVWRGTAEFVANHFKKGQMMGLHGAIQTRKYQDKEGNNRTAFEVVADSVCFAGDKAQGSRPSADIEPEGFTELDDEDLPF